MKTIFLLFFSSLAIAQTSTSTSTSTSEPTLGEKAKAGAHQVKQTVQETISNGGDRREQSKVSVIAEYSPLDLILPAKVGGSLGYIQSREKTFEVEYLGASLSAPWFVGDVGSFSDRRIALVERSYAQRNSFNIHYGLAYFDTDIHVGSSYLASATGAAVYSDLMRERSIGVIFGVGSRWTFPHGLTLSCDWFSWAQPVFVIDQDSSLINSIQDSSAKATLQDAFQASLFFPRFSFMKVGLGWAF